MALRSVCSNHAATRVNILKCWENRCADDIYMQPRIGLPT